jgi:hypothetical protein
MPVIVALRFGMSNISMSAKTCGFAGQAGSAADAFVLQEHFARRPSGPSAMQRGTTVLCKAAVSGG